MVAMSLTETSTRLEAYTRNYFVPFWHEAESQVA